MSRIDHGTREIACTVLYCGPPGSGKSSSLRYLGGRARHRQAFSTNRTDILSLDLGTIAGYAVRFRVYAPGSDASGGSHRLMLRGADGVVFVADSQAVRFDDNRAGLEALLDARDPAIPLLIQYNKQDLPAEFLVPPAELAAALGPGHPGVPTDALHGPGVFEAFSMLASLVLARFA